MGRRADKVDGFLVNLECRNNLHACGFCKPEQRGGAFLHGDFVLPWYFRHEISRRGSVCVANS